MKAKKMTDKARRYVLTCVLAFFASLAWGQGSVSGTVYDKDSGEGVMQAAVKLLRKDSSLVAGTLTDSNGKFSMNVAKDGNYIIKISSVGYSTYTHSVRLMGNKATQLGRIAMSADAIMLQGATVEGYASKVTVKEDTFQYNASAYRVPEGSAVEELVKRLPGAQVSDDGTITINGKTVKKILVDGKEFMTGDTKTAMKNLPTSIIEKVKAYDQQSDLARVTGIDDGDEQTVLDFGIKKGMNKGVLTNIDMGVGSQSRYAERGMGGYFSGKTKVMVFGNANNVNDRGFGRGGGGRNGLSATKMLGANFNYDNGKALKMDGSLRWNHNDDDTRTKTSTESFVAAKGAFSNGLTQKYARGNSWDFRYRLEWNPDSMTNIMFRPNVQYSTSDGSTRSQSATYNEDPYDYTSDPLEDAAIEAMRQQGLMVNRRVTNSISYSETKSLGAMLQLNRKLSSNGRNVTLRGDIKRSKKDATSLSTQNVHLFQVLNALGEDSTYQTNRYSLTPTTSWSYDVQATYSEPLWPKAYLQLSYKYAYSLSKSDKSTYDFSNLGENFFSGLTPEYRSWDSYLALLSNPLDSYLDTNLSRYAEYRTYTHELRLMMRITKDKMRLNFGVMMQPQRTKFTQDYLGIHTDTVRTVLNWAPTLDFRYRFNKQSNLRINYNGTTSQPSMTDLLDITDDSNPLNIVKGNPGLKPAFTHQFRLFYNGYRASHQQSVMTFLNYTNTLNSISNMVTYDETTGGKTTRPENINGNWSMMGALMLNTSIDSAGVWNVNTFTNARYNHYVAYLSQGNQSSLKNITRSTTISERLSMSYRNAWMEVGPEGSFTYTHSKNMLQPSSNLDTWNFAYGIDLDFTLPWGMSLSTDIKQNSRRGYSDASLNTNELIWNAQLSQSFLKGKPLTVSLQLYDILHQQSNLTRAINAAQRTDTEYNSINSYGMLKVNYRLNFFGGKSGRGPEGPGFGGPGRGDGRPGGNRGGMRPPMGGRPQGGFGGGFR